MPLPKQKNQSKKHQKQTKAPTYSSKVPSKALPDFIFVGSDNPAKIAAVKLAVGDIWPKTQVFGAAVSSGVSDQPIGDPQTMLGAQNRAQAALDWGTREFSQKITSRSVCLGIGLEGGVTHVGNELWSTVWAAVSDGTIRKTANGARMLIPEIVSRAILAGEEMGPIVECLVGEKDVRKKQGYIGIVTNNVVTRAQEYGNLAKLALGLWYGAGWEDLL